MGLFRRKKRELEMHPVEGRDDLVMVRQEDADKIVVSVAEDTYRLVTMAEVDEATSNAFAAAFFEVLKEGDTREEVREVLQRVDQATLTASQSVARVGYFARAAEWKRFEAARSPSGWEIAGLRASIAGQVAGIVESGWRDGEVMEALVVVAADAVRSEPLDRAADDDDDESFNLMWTIPGTGGAFRSRLRDMTLLMVIETDGDLVRCPDGPVRHMTLEDFHRVWKYGFLLRSFEEFFSENYAGPTVEELLGQERENQASVITRWMPGLFHTNRARRSFTHGFSTATHPGVRVERWGSSR